MKKVSIILSVICLLFCALAGGYLLGRNHNRSEIIISTHPTQATTQQSTKNESTPTDSTSPLLVNINTATAEEFQTLPGIGPVLAEKIVEYRRVNGSFSCVADLVNVDGIGETRLSSLLDYLTVGG